jgi:hypothetical protein
MILFELIAVRARQIRKFILLSWPEKKKYIRQFWDKYGQLYILLFIMATVVAIINVYMETLASANKNNKIKRQIGGDDTIPPVQTTLSNNTTSTSKDANTQPAKNNISGTTSKPEQSGKTANNTKKIDSGTPEKTATKTETSKNTKTETSKNTKTETNKDTINITTQVNTTLPETNSVKSSKDRISEIKERRKEKQQQRAKQSSVQQSITSLGNNLTSGLSEGTGRALSVIGTFFSAILGLILFCCAPVVIFYMWMKKLILPLFPNSNNIN